MLFVQPDCCSFPEELLAALFCLASTCCFTRVDVSEWVGRWYLVFWCCFCFEELTMTTTSTKTRKRKVAAADVAVAADCLAPQKVRCISSARFLELTVDVQSTERSPKLQHIGCQETAALTMDQGLEVTANQNDVQSSHHANNDAAAEVEQDTVAEVAVKDTDEGSKVDVTGASKTERLIKEKRAIIRLEKEIYADRRKLNNIVALFPYCDKQQVFACSLERSVA